MPHQISFQGEAANKIHLTPDAPVFRPALAIDIARVASYWSDLELHWAIAYTYILGNQDQDAFSKYFSLRAWDKRRKLFMNAAAAYHLPGPLKTEAFNLYTDFEKLATERNQIVHGTWAHHDDYPESLFTSQPRSLGVQLNKVFRALVNVGTKPGQYPEVSVNLARGTYDEYKHDDFEDIVARIRGLAGKVDALGQKILAHSLERVGQMIQRQRGNK